MKFSKENKQMRSSPRFFQNSSLRKPNRIIKRPTFFSSLTSWIFEKDQRSTIIWSGVACGSFLIGGYYLWLGFTPTFNLAQAPLLLMQAFIIGILLTFYFAAILFFPAWGYRILDIEVENFKSEHRQAVVSALSRRSITAQIFTASLVFLLITPSPFSAPDPLPVYWGIALNLLIYSSVFLIFMPRTSEYGLHEKTTTYVLTIIVLGFFGLISLTMLFFTYELAPDGKKTEDWSFFLGWLLVTVISAALGTLRRKDWKLGILIGLTTFLLLLKQFNAILMPFQATAAAIGIKEPRPVTLIFPSFPSTTCTQVRRALDNPKKLTCEGNDAGILKEVHLLNTLGDRWVLRETEDSENIVFDGKGVVVKRNPNKSRKNLDKRP